MRVEAAITARLLATAPLTALVGTRIYPSKAKQDGARPYLVYDLQGGSVLGTHDGGPSLRDGRLSFSVTANTYAETKAVTQALRGALLGLKEELSGVQVSVHTTYEDEDLYDDLLGVYVAVCDFELIWLE